MARTRLCNLWSRRQLLVTFLEGHSGGSLLPTSQAAQCLSHTRISKLSTSSNVVAKQPLAAAEDGAAGNVQQVAGGRSLPSSTTDDLESIRLRAWSKISQASPALSGSILPIPLAAQMAFVRRSGTRATSGKWHWLLPSLDHCSRLGSMVTLGMCSGQASVPHTTDSKSDELATAKFVRVAAILVVFAVGMTTLPKLGTLLSGHLLNAHAQQLCCIHPPQACKWSLCKPSAICLH